MILAYLKVDKLLCAFSYILGSGAKLADSAINGTLFAICSAMAAMVLMQVNMIMWTPYMYYIKENYSYCGLNVLLAIVDNH